MPFTPTGIAVALVLGLWLLASVLVQASMLFRNFGRYCCKFLKHLKEWDHFGLLPCFTFFSLAPDFDFRLLYRDKLVDGQFSPWRLIETKMSRWKWLWNPGKRKIKALDDICHAMISMAASELRCQKTHLLTQFPYLELAYHVSGIAPAALSRQRQFMVARTFGYISDRQPEILFISPLFRLPAAVREGTS